MLVHKRTHIVNNTTNRHKRLAIRAGLGCEVVPGDDGQLREWDAPIQACALAVEGFLLLLQAAFFDFVGAEGLETVCLGEERENGKGVDEPLCRVVLVPDYCVAWYDCQPFRSVLLIICFGLDLR